MIRNEDVAINGDGETSRDFCFIQNVIQMNILAALANEAARNQVYNVAVNARTSLNQLFHILAEQLREQGIAYDRPAVYRDFRAGDVRHSQADISKARTLLGYEPTHTITQGLAVAMPWYVQSLSASQA